MMRNEQRTARQRETEDRGDAELLDRRGEHHRRTHLRMIAGVYQQRPKERDEQPQCLVTARVTRSGAVLPNMARKTAAGATIAAAATGLMRR